MGWWSQLQTGASCTAGVCLLGLDVGCGFCSASLWYWEVRRCSILGKVWCEDHVKVGLFRDALFVPPMLTSWPMMRAFGLGLPACSATGLIWFSIP